MKFLSLFSGIEAASVAWKPLGWECIGVAEIDPFPCAVLKHHYPDVPNLGSVTEIADDMIAALGPFDLVVGGSPCQDLSVAGKRAGLAGARSGLFHHQLRIFHAARHLCGARWLLWENVPGAFSTNGGRDFAVVVGDMAGLSLSVPDGGWGSEGVALGENGLVEWSVLDAQWFGVAQRRRRVFALLDTGDWANRPPVLLIPESLRGDYPPSREAGKVAPTIPSRSTAGGGLGTDFDCDGGVIDVCPTLRAGGNRTGGDRPPGTDVDTADSLIPVGVTLHGSLATERVASMTDVSSSLRARIPSGVENSTTTAVLQPIPFDTTQITSAANYSRPQAGDPCHPLAAGAHPPAIAQPAEPYTLAIRGRGDSHQLEYRQDGTANALLTPNGGRGGIGVGAVAQPIAFHPTQDPITSTDGTTHCMGTGSSRGNATVAVAFSAKDYGGDATADLSPTLRAMPHDGSHANGGRQVAVAVAVDTYNHTITGDYTGSITTTGGPPLSGPGVLQFMAVRRLTPVECSRLQGFPDDYLLQVPWRGKTPPPDGPMYKALGNSMAVPVMAWIGRRIQEVADV